MPQGNQQAATSVGGIEVQFHDGVLYGPVVHTLPGAQPTANLLRMVVVPLVLEGALNKLSGIDKAVGWLHWHGQKAAKVSHKEAKGTNMGNFCPHPSSFSWVVLRLFLMSSKKGRMSFCSDGQNPRQLGPLMPMNGVP